jgi:hypothetical protein
MSNSPDITPSPPHRFRVKAEYLIALVLVFIAALIMIAFFERISLEGNTLAIDWKSLYPNLKDGHIVYRGGSVMIAPWSLPAILPLGFFSLRASWALLALATLTVLALSVPHRRNQRLALILLLTSFPVLRQVVDGNVEVLVIAGVLLLIYGFRSGHLIATVIGLLLATAKPQETWLLMLVLATYFLRAWSLQRIFELGMSLAIIVVPALLLFGGAWRDAMQNIFPPPGTEVDITLWACLHRLGAGTTIAIIVWILFFAATIYITLFAKPTLSREKAAMLIAASLLLAPYAAGNSFLTVLAVGIIPLFQSRPRLGWFLILLIDLQYILQFVARDFLYANGAYYWMLMLVFVWAYWGWQIYKTETSESALNKVLLSRTNS